VFHFAWNLSTQVFTIAPFCFTLEVLHRPPPSEEIVLLESQAEEDAKHDTRTDAAGHFSPQDTDASSGESS